MPLMPRSALPYMVLAGLFLFQAAVHLRDGGQGRLFEPDAAIVMPAAMQVILYGGDRFLAADVEAVRAVMSGGGSRESEAAFRLRAHREVANLNPCHEDNYWIGNAELTWGGTYEAGLDLLDRATACRFWDEWPPFFFGFNQYFFNRNIAEGQRGLNIAAERSRDEKNIAAFRTLSVMLEVGRFSDVRMALNLIESERDKATDQRLRDRLDKRARRLQGLLALRDAQAAYEARHGRPLTDPQEIFRQGFLPGIPDDPLGIGYAFERGTFQLHSRTNESLERLRRR